MESLHIGRSNQSSHVGQTESDASLLKLIRFDWLTTLSLNGFELFSGDFFENVRHFSFSISLL